MPGSSVIIHLEIFAKILFRGKFHENKTIRNDEIILSLLMLVNHAFVANILVYTTLALNSGLYDGFLFYVIIYSPEV